jgi:hypothetical protein
MFQDTARKMFQLRTLRIPFQLNADMQPSLRLKIHLKARNAIFIIKRRQQKIIFRLYGRGGTARSKSNLRYYRPHLPHSIEENKNISQKVDLQG